MKRVSEHERILVCVSPSPTNADVIRRAAALADALDAEEIETRPFNEKCYLIVGSSLCGGRAYATLASFFAHSGVKSIEPRSRMLPFSSLMTGIVYQIFPTFRALMC